MEVPSNKSALVNTSAITEFDILFGRGAYCSCHMGSIALKVIVVSRLDSYVKSKSQTVKNHITRDILRAVQLSGGRFLAKLEQGKTTGNKLCKTDNAWWYEIERKKAHIKIRDTLRDCIKSIRKVGYPSVLLYRTGLSGVFDRDSTFPQIIEHAAKSSTVSEYVRSRSGVLPGREGRLSIQTISKRNSKARVPRIMNDSNRAIDACLSSGVKDEQHGPIPLPPVCVQRPTLSLSVPVATLSCASVLHRNDSFSNKRTAKTKALLSYHSGPANSMVAPVAFLVRRPQDKRSPEAADPTPAVVRLQEESLKPIVIKVKASGLRKDDEENDTLQAILEKGSPLSPSYSPNSPFVGTQCPWHIPSDSQDDIQNHLIAPVTKNVYGNYAGHGLHQPTLPPFLPLEHDILKTIDDSECVTSSKMIEDALALSHEDGDDALLDYYFSRTKAALSRNQNRRNKELGRCCVCNQFHDERLWRNCNNNGTNVFLD